MFWLDRVTRSVSLHYLGSQIGTFEIIYPNLLFISQINLFKYLLSTYYVSGNVINNGRHRAPLRCAQEMRRPRPRETRKLPNGHKTPGLVQESWIPFQCYLPQCEKTCWRDFPGSPVVKNLPSKVGDAGSIPDQGTKIPHATGQLSSYATTTEPAHHN